jgi:outer membrane protein assembly factor BamB
VAVSADGAYVAAGSWGYPSSWSVYLFNRQGTLLWTRSVPPIRSLAINAVGSLITIDRQMASPSSCTEGQSYLDILGNPVANPASPPPDKSLSTDGSVRVCFDQEKVFLSDRRGNVLWTYPMYQPWLVAISADGSLVAANSHYSAGVVLIDRQGKLLTGFSNGYNCCSAFAFSADGLFLGVADFYSPVRLFSIIGKPP